MKLKKLVALVTGASSGIGKATADRLATAGYKVYGTSRRGATPGQRSFEMLSLDVTSDESVAAAVNALLRSEGRVDLLVNNAGFSVAPAGAEESSIEQARAIFETNFFGIVRMTRAVVPHMRRQGAGRIINIGSVLGFLPAPYMALYAATKHAVEGYSESLDHELRTRGIRVSVIEPAYTKTQFDANFLEPDAKLDEYREVRAALGKRLKEVMAAADQPGVVADVVLQAASAARPKLRYTAGGVAGRLRLLRRFAPAGVVDAGLRKDLQLDALTASLPRPPVLEKESIEERTMPCKALLAAKTGETMSTTVVDMHEHYLMPEDVTIAVDYSTVNDKDALAIPGRADVMRQFPVIPGIDFAGTVEASSYPGIAVGDRD